MSVYHPLLNCQGFLQHQNISSKKRIQTKIFDFSSLRVHLLVELGRKHRSKIKMVFSQLPSSHVRMTNSTS